MNGFNASISPALIDQVALNDMAATCKLGEIFFQQKRYGLAKSLFSFASAHNIQAAKNRLVEIEQLTTTIDPIKSESTTDK